MGSLNRKPFGFSPSFGRSNRVYVSGAITHASRRFASRIDRTKILLREAEFEVLDFVLDPRWSDREVFRHDMSCIERCDFMLGFLDEPSTGVGAEMVWALTRFNKPVLLVTRADRVSRFISGHQALYPAPKLQVLRYQNPSQLVFVLLREYVKEMMF